MEFDPQQGEAIALCCDTTKRIVGVTGAAGTGKTSIMREVHRLLTDAGYVVVLCAPTGKAAKRIFEATGIPASTIHRLLEYTHPGDRDPKTGKCYGVSFPRRDQAVPVEADVIICDEYAMVSKEVNRSLLNAVKPGGVVRVFGDLNQLPPIEKDQSVVGPSSFSDLLARFSSVTLQVIHRQGEGSGIVANGARINRGMAPQRNADFGLIVTDKPTTKLQELLMEGDVSYAEPQNQIITPSKASWTGTVKLNALLQNLYRTESDGWLNVPRHQWDRNAPVRVRKGDKVIYHVNNYDLELFNGEAGLVVEITDLGEIAIDLGDREIVLPPMMEYFDSNGIRKEFDPRRDLHLAYAITTHKAQGSEYDNVVYVLNKSTHFVQLRSNFYTAVTRARNKVTVITDTRSLGLSVTRKTPVARPTKQTVIA